MFVAKLDMKILCGGVEKSATTLNCLKYGLFALKITAIVLVSS